MFHKIRSLFNGFYNFLLTILRRRFLIFEMAKRDIAKEHVGSMLGFFWTFINPLITIFILWVVFSVGFKAAPKGNVPFVVWLTAAMAIWNTFSEIIMGSTGSIIGNSHLVKKVVFPLSILPVVKLVGSFITHAVFLLILIVMIVLYRMPFSIYWLQALYYFAAMSVLALGLSWIASSVNIFARDTAQIVNVILQFGFWGTPIFWDLGMMPAKVQFVLKFNPMFYIVQGYRESFIYFVPFWHHWQMTLYYWGVTAFVFALGAIVFLRLRPHFADVL
jgi:homopolymeric O-antigen transport system permease protein